MAVNDMKLFIILFLLCHIKARSEVEQVEIRLDGLSMRLIKMAPKTTGLDDSVFYILDTEVTNYQYSIFLKESGRVKGGPNNSLIKKKGAVWEGANFPEGMGDHPVVLISVQDCKMFCDWLTKRCPMLKGKFRIPTKDEWLFAAYGPNRKYPWGDDVRHNAYHIKNLKFANKSRTTNPVKACKRGVTPEGLYGMWGNVNELVALDIERINNEMLHPFWLGGSFMNEKPFKPRQSYWGYADAFDFQADDIGFRVVFKKQ